MIRSVLLDSYKAMPYKSAWAWASGLVAQIMFGLRPGLNVSSWAFSSIYFFAKIK
jgi:hypothetical protein